MTNDHLPVMNEFEIIEHFFKNLTDEDPRVVCGIGDDAAVIDIPTGQELAVSVDTLVCGVHFLADVDPSTLGYKALAVNLSDLAAMGAQPAWATLALTMPEHDASWLKGFASGFAQLARRYSVSLIGGDLSSGPLSISVQVMGLVEPGLALTRSGARVGDDVYISGYPGEAGYGLSLLTGPPGWKQDVNNDCLERLLKPEPRVELGRSLSGIAHAAIDVSDGLAADLGHIVSDSAVGAVISLDCIPVRPPLSGLQEKERVWNFILGSGDDYELCFTVPEALREQTVGLIQSLDYPVTRIGKIISGAGIRIMHADGGEHTLFKSGFMHF